MCVVDSDYHVASTCWTPTCDKWGWDSRSQSMSNLLFRWRRTSWFVSSSHFFCIIEVSIVCRAKRWYHEFELRRLLYVSEACCDIVSQRNDDHYYLWTLSRQSPAMKSGDNDCQYRSITRTGTAARHREARRRRERLHSPTPTAQMAT